MLSSLKHITLSILSVLFLWGSLGAQAEQIKQLHSQTILVANQTPEERHAAAAKALAKVMVRMSGDVAVLDVPKIQSVVARAEAYLESFHYEASEALIDYQGQQVQASRLILKFSGAALEKELRGAEQRLWPANRPSVLVWLVRDGVQGRQVINPAEDEMLESALVGAAADVGLPLLMPLLDLQDQMAINANQLWRLDQEAIRNASRRYPVDAQLVGRYSQTSSGEWMASWSFEHKSKQQLFDSRGETQADMFAGGLQSVAGYLARLYGVVASNMPSNAVVVTVQGISGFGSYIQALEYLNELAIVGHVAPLSVDGNSMTLALYIEGDKAVLMDTLALDKKMSGVENLGAPSGGAIYPAGSVNNPLKFEWVGASRR